MKRDKPKAIGDCNVGDIVRCPHGLVRVGAPLAYEFICRPVAHRDGLYVEIGGPFFLAPETPVLERLRDRGWYVERNAAVAQAPDNGDADPMLGGG